jgi:hypothetical protein
MARYLTSLLLVLCTAIATLGQGEGSSVRLSATVQSTPPRITLNWTAYSGTTGITIYRKLKGGTSWGSALATPASSSLQYVDNAVALNTSYEYKVVRTSTTYMGYGYVNAGIEMAMTETRGSVVLLVDNTFTTALSTQLAELQKDFEGDGWTVVRHDVSRTASVTSVKGLVVAAYNANPTQVKAVFIVGHVPVPYSGQLAPDGHGDHWGAWSADVYYGDVNGTWTDATAWNTAPTDSRNDNIPGDGKFDQSTIPSAVELAVGRVDFANLPAFAQSEQVLLSNYLTKLHNWKVKSITAQARGLVDDNFVGMPQGFSQNGWRGFAPLVGHENVSAGDYFTGMAGQSYLWSYGCGGGWWDNANGVGSTQQFTTSNLRTIFTVLFGSYFGDFDCSNNFMRASLASGQTLTCFWAGFPSWFFHHMGLGETIGFSTLLTQNNGNEHYAPNNTGAGQVHIALLGDPTLRQNMVAPATAVNTQQSGSNNVQITWSASAEATGGYHVYRKVGTAAWVRRTTAAVTTASYTDNVQGLSGTVRYMVRALRLETTPSGSFWNLSTGAQAQITLTTGSVDCAGVVGGTALPGSSCNDGNACTGNDVYGSNCVCAGTPQPDADGDGICNAQDACPNGPNPGSACNDGNALTGNDKVGSNCLCAGSIIDCNGVPGGGAVMDDCGVCGGTNACQGNGSFCVDFQASPVPDAEEAENGNIYANSGALDLVYDSDPGGFKGAQLIGLRYVGVGIPAGATITSATIQFTSNGTSSGTAKVRIAAQRSANAPPIGYLNGDLSSRQRTLQRVLWQPADWSVANQSAAAQRTPNLKKLVQEVVDDPNWQAGNAILFLISGSGVRKAWSFDQDPGRAATLCITYKLPGAMPVVDGTSDAGTAKAEGEIRPATVRAGNLVLFPNPTRDMLTLKMEGADAMLLQGATVAVHDMLGRSLLRATFGPQLSLAQLAPGTYTLTLLAADGSRLEQATVVREP